MAKVTGPLQSFSASGKLANSIVFAAWKGVAYVRKHFIPANPQTAGQGDQRIFMGGTGKAVGKVAVGSDIDGQLSTLGVIPSGQSKQSYLVKYILSNYLSNATNYATQLAALTGHTTYTSFGVGADTLGLTEFDLAYASVAPYDKALGLYLMAKACIALGFTGTPYTVAIASWTGAQIDAFVADFSA